MIKIDVKKSYTQNVDNDVDKEKWLKIYQNKKSQHCDKIKYPHTINKMWITKI